MQLDIDTIIFDCDGVLVDSEVLAIRGERVALAEFGLQYSPEDYVMRFVGLHDGLFFDQLRKDYEAAFSRAAPEDFEERVLEGRARERHLLEPVKGADSALKKARELGGLAIASSSRAHFLKSKLERTGLYDLAAPHIYSADLVAYGKPAPDIFLYAAEKLGVDPGRCLVLEDSANGVKAGLAAGMNVWGFTGGGHCPAGYAARLQKAGAAHVLGDFQEFISAIAA
ncbi:MAG: HAD-IA family hydrolase [Parvularculaceae bacterium]